jgi:hypothetical protein
VCVVKSKPNQGSIRNLKVLGITRNPNLPEGLDMDLKKENVVTFDIDQTKRRFNSLT